MFTAYIVMAYIPVAKRTKSMLISNSYGLVLYSYGLRLWPAYL